MSRSLANIFCEEVRQEAGGKFLMVGVYPNLLLVEKFPSKLSKLTSYVVLSTPIPEENLSLLFEVLRNGEPIVSQELQLPIKGIKPPDFDLTRTGGLFQVPFAIELQEVEIDADTNFQTRLTLQPDGEVLLGPVLSAYALHTHTPEMVNLAKNGS